MSGKKSVDPDPMLTSTVSDLGLYSGLFVWTLTFVLLNQDIPCFANSVDPDQLASEEANWSGSALFAIKFVNL